MLFVEGSGDDKAGNYFHQIITLAIWRRNVASLLATIPQGMILNKFYL